MHPVTERFLLIERLDKICLISAIVVCLVLWICAIVKGRKKEWGRWEYAWKAVWVVETLATLTLFGYLFWRFFLAWKGIYYP